MRGDDHILQIPQFTLRRKGLIFKDIKDSLNSPIFEHPGQCHSINGLSPADIEQNGSVFNQVQFLLPEEMVSLRSQREGYNEGILLDHCGYVAEGSGENLFLVRDRVLLTPGNDASILNGITRDSVITLARDMGLEVRETHLTRSDLYLADELFFTGTAAEITPIREIDRRVVGNGQAGPVTRSLQRAFFEVVQGKDARYHRWLDFYEPQAL